MKNWRKFLEKLKNSFIINSTSSEHEKNIRVVQRLSKNITNQFVCTDETRSPNCGIFNKNSECILATETPKPKRQVRSQNRFSSRKPNFETNYLWENFKWLNNKRCLVLLRTHLREYLGAYLTWLPLLSFQRDGTPRQVTDFLIE